MTFAPWKKNYNQSRQHIKKQRHYFANKGPSSQSYGFCSSHIWMWELEYKESYRWKNWCFWTVVLENQVQETQRVPNRINPRENTPRHILIKLTKVKHKRANSKSSKGKKQQITHKGIPIRITANLSMETIQARRERQDILKVMREKPTTQITIPSKDLIQIWRGNQKLYRQAKVERIQHHQTSSWTNAKGSSLDRKHRKGL